MVSFDVASLHTNIPLKELIDLAVSYIKEGNTKLKFSRLNLTKCFQWLLLKLIFCLVVNISSD